MLSASYSVNGKMINKDDVKNIQINKKDYVDYVENIKQKTTIFHKGYKHENEVEKLL